MSSLPILVGKNHPDLRKIAEPITKFQMRHYLLSQKMLRTMELLKAAGLAACQVGVNIQLFVYQWRTSGGWVANPKVLVEVGKQESIEGCLSLPGTEVALYTPKVLEVEFDFIVPMGNWQLDVRKIRTTLVGPEAIVFAHEMDHLRGKLITDYLEQPLARRYRHFTK